MTFARPVPVRPTRTSPSAATPAPRRRSRRQTPVGRANQLARCAFSVRRFCDSRVHSGGLLECAVDRPELDYFGLFDASPNPYFVLDRGLHIVGANRAYL